MKIIVYGEPASKGRPRFNRKTGFAYTPSETRQAEKDFLTQILPYRPKEPIKTDIELELNFYFSIPQSKSNKWKNRAIKNEVRPRKKDIDNLIKLVLDSMNKIFWLDDRQIVELTARKFYSAIPRTEIQIKEITNEAD